MSYVGWSARALSLVKKDFLLAEPQIVSYDTPLWHWMLFRNSQHLTYFGPCPIRLRVLTLGQLLKMILFFHFLQQLGFLCIKHNQHSLRQLRLSQLACPCRK